MAVPQSNGEVLAALDAGAVTLAKTFQENTVYLRVRGPASLLGRFRSYWSEQEVAEAGIVGQVG